MARILFVNTVCNGSTGKICKDLYNLASEVGHECVIAYGRGDNPKEFNTIKIGNNLDVYNHVILTRLFDKHGLGSKTATKKFLKSIDEFAPDIIHLHNIHGYYLNIDLLFEYLSLHPRIKIVWTLHDCWAFTGHCSYFILSNCNKWEDNCSECKNYKDYPKTYFKYNTTNNYKLKLKNFTKLEAMQIVTPSLWLKKLADRSFLNKYEICVINNGIDIGCFKNNYHSNVRNKKIILGVANIWDERKGLKYFLELNDKIDKSKYQIVMVGLNKEQIESLPSNIVGMQRTNSIEDLVELYQEADVLFNPTLEDNYPTVNLEAQACGTPVMAFDSGGTRETLFSTSSIVQNVDEFISKLDIIERTKKEFEMNYDDVDYKVLFKKYLELYEKILL